MSNIKRGLGKGLNALIPEGSVFMGGRTIINIDINKIIPNPRQPRLHFSDKAIQELANSIKEQGIIQPVLVRMKQGTYELIAGERRFRAAKIAGLNVIPAIVKDFSDQQSLEIALIENLQREDLNPMEAAEAYQKLSSEFDIPQEEIAKRVGKSRSSITNTLRLLTLPDEIKESLRSNKISAGHARALLALDTKEKQLELWNKIIETKMSVRDVETVAGVASPNKPQKQTARKKFTRNLELKNIEEQLTTRLATKVRIFGQTTRGKIEINYFSKEDLERLVEEISK